MKTTTTEYGLEFATDYYTGFFGFKGCTLEKLKELFPRLDFQTMHQVHGDYCTVIQAPESSEPKADALVTSVKNIALVIKSADCIPIIIFDPDQKKIAAIHAGWRGVENRIFPKVLQDHFKKTENLIIHIGPHILQNSFEVQSDVKDLLLRCTKSPVPPEVCKKSEAGFNIDLHSLVQLQAAEFSISGGQILSLLEDTKTSPHLNSYRRDQKNASRNLSFIALA